MAKLSGWSGENGIKITCRRLIHNRDEYITLHSTACKRAGETREWCRICGQECLMLITFRKALFAIPKPSAAKPHPSRAGQLLTSLMDTLRRQRFDKKNIGKSERKQHKFYVYLHSHKFLWQLQIFPSLKRIPNRCRTSLRKGKLKNYISRSDPFSADVDMREFIM